MTHDAAMVVLSVLIAIATAYGGLRAFLARQGGVQLALSAVAFGFAVAGMHYTAMAGMHLVPLAERTTRRRAGGVLADAVAGRGAALLRDRGRLPAVAGAGTAPEGAPAAAPCDVSVAGHRPLQRSRPAHLHRPPVRGCGQRRSAASASRPALPRRRGCRSKAPTAPISSISPTSEASGPTPIIQRCMTAPGSGCARGRSRRPKPSSTLACSSGCTAATSWRSPMSLSSARKATAPSSSSTAPSPHRVPVSRAKIAEVKARLGLGERGMHPDWRQQDRSVSLTHSCAKIPRFVQFSSARDPWRPPCLRQPSGTAFPQKSAP